MFNSTSIFEIIIASFQLEKIEFFSQLKKLELKIKMIFSPIKKSIFMVQQLHVSKKNPSNSSNSFSQFPYVLMNYTKLDGDLQSTSLGSLGQIY